MLRTVAHRWDVSPLGKFERTPTGGLRIPATPARTGVQIYLNPDGTERREYRPAEEVFAPESLASFRGAVVTHLHPSQHSDTTWVTPEDWRRLAVGHVGDNVGRAEQHPTCDVLVQDGEMIRGVERGDLRDLSCGYTCDYDATPGVTPEGESYDGIQRNIRINHVALLPPGAGRAGPTAALRLDAREAFQPGALAPTPQVTERVIMKIVIDGREFEKGSDEHIAYVTDAANARIKAAEDKAAADAKAAKERADAIEREAKELPGRIAKRKRFCEDIGLVRLAIERDGGRIDAPPPSEDPAAGDEQSVIANVLGMLVPGFDAKGKDPAYLEGALMMLVTQLKSEPSEPDADDALDARPADPGDAPAAPLAPPARTDRREVEPDPYYRNLAATENLWRKPLAASRS